MRAGVLVLLFLVLVVPAATGKDVAALVVVGADGRGARIEAEPGVLGVLLYNPASVHNVRPKPAAPRGGYVKVYPLASDGLPEEPGRFYPATRALCFSWNQAAPPHGCARLAAPPRLLALSRRVAPFHGRPAALSALLPGGTENLFVAIELAFDRYRDTHPSVRPSPCLRFTAVWSGAEATRRPTRICVSRSGVYARERLYPASPAIWRLARDSG